MSDPVRAQAQNGHTISIIDLGSNSLRMMIARVRPGGVVKILNEVKHMVRLGEGAFPGRRLQPQAMDRTLEMLYGFAGMGASYGVDCCLAVATAAVREALNGGEFLQLVREKTGLDFSVISGREEARLIWKGVSGYREHTKEKKLFLDIGGGSTELVVGNSLDCSSLDSLKVGCVRLASTFPCPERPVSAKEYASLQLYVNNVGVHVFRRLTGENVSGMIASSGTAQNLAEITAALEEKEGKGAPDTPWLLSYRGLRRTVRELCARTRTERAALPGINPQRVDVIIPGAAILQTVMETLYCDSVQISSRGLRDGLLLEYLERTFPDPAQATLSIREKSVLHLGRLCRFEEVHSRHVAQIADELFDSARKEELHCCTEEDRELLRYAALLHDVGIFIAFSQHHAHSHYLISNMELLGFTEKERRIIATTTFFHRFKPTKKYPCFAALEGPLRQTVRVLSLLLAMAEGLDKSHQQIVQNARFIRTQNMVRVEVRSTASTPLEEARMSRFVHRLEKFCNVPVKICFLKEFRTKK